MRLLYCYSSGTQNPKNAVQIHALDIKTKQDLDMHLGKLGFDFSENRGFGLAINTPNLR
jgi:hypothetical protein